MKGFKKRYLSGEKVFIFVWIWAKSRSETRVSHHSISQVFREILNWVSKSSKIALVLLSCALRLAKKKYHDPFDQSDSKLASSATWLSSSSHRQRQLELLLALREVNLCSDWLLWLLWSLSYDTQSKITLSMLSFGIINDSYSFIFSRYFRIPMTQEQR